MEGLGSPAVGNMTTPAPSVVEGATKRKTGLKLNAVFMNWMSPLPWANSLSSPLVVSKLPKNTPACGERNCINVNADTLRLSPPFATGKVWLVFTGMSAPVNVLTPLEKLPSTSRVMNPPGHHPSFWVSTLTVRFPRPPYSQVLFLPPSATSCPIWVRLRSVVTPFAAISLRAPPQSPVSVERFNKSPEYVGDASCATACVLRRDIPTYRLVAKIIVRFIFHLVSF